jgi:hypothetical protein
MLDKRVIFCTTISNEEKNFNNFFKLIDKLKKIFNESYIILIESDSTDNTNQLFENEMESRNGEIHSLGNLRNKFVKRSKRLEVCRNKYLSLINNNKFLREFDYMIVLDADNVNELLSPEVVNKSLVDLKNEEWSCIFPNQLYFYYDIWALRIQKLYETDCFKEFKNLLKNNSYKKSYHLSITKKMFFLKNSKDRYIKVISAFGGMGIYKIKNILDIYYDSKGGKECEHVYFHQKIYNKYNSLFIDKKLINSKGINLHVLYSIAYSFSNFFAKRFYKKIFNKE